MKLSSSVAGQYTVVHASGDLDLATADQLRATLDQILETGATLVVLDLTEVDFLDSSTLGVFIRIHKRLTERDGALELICPRKAILRILQMTGLDRVFVTYASLADVPV
jgi:anti-sigma B factor antagonist